MLILIIGLTGCVTPEKELTSTSSSTPSPKPISTPTPTPEVVRLRTYVRYIEPYPLAFYNAFYESKIPDITFKVYNLMNYPIAVKLTSEYQGISYRTITTETIMPRETKTINQTIQLIKEKIDRIKTKTKVSLHYKIEYKKNNKWNIWDEKTVMVDVYPKDTMVWALRDKEGNYYPLYNFIAVFVTPKVDKVQELLSIAKEYHPKRSLAGYQSDVLSQIEAIYYALQKHYRVSYVSTPIAFGKDEVQKVRLPKESLYLSSANCIDGAVLFASAIEALGMKPYIVIVPNHAFVAWYDVDKDAIYALETTKVGQIKREKGWDLIYDEYKVIKDGYKFSLGGFESGYYKISLSSDVGVEPAILTDRGYLYKSDTEYVKWYKELDISSGSVLEITNPTIFGLGKSANVHVVIYKFHPREYYSFEDAFNLGLEELNQYWDALTDDNPWNGIIVDVKAMHDAGVLPME